MRSNHGPYNVTLDGQLYQDTGFYNGDAFQQVLFSAKGLNSTRPHTVSIINSRTDPIRPYLDIDSVSVFGFFGGDVTRNLESDEFAKTIVRVDGRLSIK